MPDEENGEADAPVSRPAPQSYADFLSRHFTAALIMVGLLLAAAFVPIEGSGGVVAPLIDFNSFMIGLVVFVLVFVVVPQMAFFGKRREEAAAEISPVDPRVEIPLIEEEFARRGRKVRIDSVDSDPWEGEGAGQPEVFHYIGKEFFANGTEKPFIVSQGGLTRLPTRWGNQALNDANMDSNVSFYIDNSDPSCTIEAKGKKFPLSRLCG